MDPHVDDGQLNALLDGELDAAGRAAVESHLAACADCRGRYEEARRFLAQASDLLGYLDAPAVKPAQPAAPPAAVPGERRVAATAREPAVVLPGPGVAKTAKEPAVNPAAVPKTVKEKAIDVPLTAEVPALPAEPPATGVRPIFGQAKRGGDEEPPQPRAWGLRPLAWAAMLVVGLGGAWLVNQARRPPQAQLEVAAGPPLDTAPAAEPAAAPVIPQAPARTPRTPLVKPRTMRTEKPPTADEAAARIPLDRPAGASKRTDDVALAPATAAAGAGARSGQPSAGALGAVAAPVPTTAARSARTANSARAAETTAAAAPSAFQRITLDEAVRRLSGSIRLIDGLQPGEVEAGPGLLVPGAAPDREVVRVYYRDEAGRPLILDQQPGETPSANSVNGLMRGDTLVTQEPDGTVRVRWVDRKSFWLSLTGAGGPDTVRMLVERIR